VWLVTDNAMMHLMLFAFTVVVVVSMKIQIVDQITDVVMAQCR
jgi:hypothetical protein